MNMKAVVWTCAAILVLSALAGTALSASYEGVVTGNSVYVRSGPGGVGTYPSHEDSPPRPR